MAVGGHFEIWGVVEFTPSGRYTEANFPSQMSLNQLRRKVERRLSQTARK